MKLILHIGTHKTGSTTIQRFCSANSKELLKNGIWYPYYSEVIDTNRNHYAHLDLAKGIMDESTIFTEEKVSQFFKNLYDKALNKNIHTILISAEPFYRGYCKDINDVWESRKCFIEKVKGYLIKFDVEISIVLRRHDNYLESLYNEQVKVTRYSGDIYAFLKEFNNRFQYQKNINLWKIYFPTIKVHLFENLILNNNLISNYFKELNIDVDVSNKSNKSNNVSLPIVMIEYKRYCNSSSLSKAQLNKLFSNLEQIYLENKKDFKFKKYETRFSSQERKKILRAFEDDINSLNKNYFPYGNGYTFNNDSDNNNNILFSDLEIKDSMYITSLLLKKLL